MPARTTARRVLIAAAASLTIGLGAGAGAGVGAGAGSLGMAPATVVTLPAETAPAASSAAAAPLPAYRSSVAAIDATLAARMRFSWRGGCPVPLRDLRYLRVTYYGFDGLAHTGELVVHRDVATAVTGIFRRLYDARFPVARMRLVDAYRGDDDASMAANNTSAFNCRVKTGGTGWSVHSYGRALDINPVHNPYVKGATVLPAAGRAYLDRWPLRKGMVTWTVRDAFADAGWSWGGSWTRLKDYQHFERVR